MKDKNKTALHNFKIQTRFQKQTFLYVYAYIESKV